MKTKSLLCLIILWLSIQPTYAQKVTIGLESGVNYSNLRKAFDYDRFDAMQGPVNGFVLKYELGNWLSLQSGLTQATYYYNEYVNYWIDYYPAPNYSITAPPIDDYPGPQHYTQLEASEFNFLRVPLLIKFKTPGRANIGIGGGPYYAFLVNDELRGKDRDIYSEEYIDENFPKMHDWGWILESSFNYNINSRWSVSANARVTYGKEKYVENVEGKMGSTEFTLGVGYKPFKEGRFIQTTDSIGKNVSVLPQTKDNTDKYKSSPGFTSGVTIKFFLDENLSILTGTWYERKGYNLNYKGDQIAYYHEVQSYPTVESNVQLDYLTIPLMVDLEFGKKVISHINFGAYFSLLQNAFAEGFRLYQNEYNSGYRNEKQYFNESLDYWFDNTDSGIMLAYRLDVPVFKWASSFVAINQSIGIKNILNSGEEFQSQYNSLGDLKMQNLATSIQIGLSIPVNKN